MLVIRPAVPADAPAIAGLTRQLSDGIPLEVARARACDLCDAHEGCLLVADLDGSVVGWLQVATRNFILTGRGAEIAGLVVDESVRSQGIGAKLVEAAESWAKSAGLSTIRVRSRVSRDRAHKFYERLGYGLTKEQKVFDKKL